MLTTLLALFLSHAEPTASNAACAAKLKPLRPLGCSNGYVTCYCDDNFDWSTCRWIWICK